MDVSSNRLTPQDIFSQSVNASPYIYPHIYSIYQKSPSKFAQTLLDSILTISPKILRLVAYVLYTHGITFQDLYDLYSGIPEFIFSLNQVPNESMLVLLKYDFPRQIEGNSFLWWSLNQISSSQVLSNLDWLDFTLDICAHLSIDLNSPNQKTGQTLLQEAISQGSLNLTLRLLCHGLDPNRKSVQGNPPLETALNLFSSANVLIQKSQYLNLIRQLVRYGAVLDDRLQKIISKNFSEDSEQILKNVRIGKKLKPDYCPYYQDYFACDEIEDLTLIARSDPSVIYSENFRQRMSGVDLSQFSKSLSIERAQTQLTSQGLLEWPQYIDKTLTAKNTCSELLPDDITVAQLPSPEKVDQMMLKGLPNLKPLKTNIQPTLYPTQTPSSWKPSTGFSVQKLPWGSENLPPTPFAQNLSTRPLISYQMVPTSNPGLPSL